MVRGRLSAGMLAVCALLFSGCASEKIPETFSENAFVIGQDGVVTEYLVDTFDKEYYQIAGLEEMVRAEASDYNSAGAKAPGAYVNVKKVEALSQDDNMVLVSREYDSGDSYGAFTGNAFYYGTIAQANAQLSQLGAGRELTGVKKNDTIGLAQLIAMQQKHIIITDVPSVIYCPYAVEYISAGLQIREDGGVDTTGAADATVIIVLKK